MVTGVKQDVIDKDYYFENLEEILKSCKVCIGDYVSLVKSVSSTGTILIIWQRGTILAFSLYVLSPGSS